MKHFSRADFLQRQKVVVLWVAFRSPPSENPHSCPITPCNFVQGNFLRFFPTLFSICKRGGKKPSGNSERLIRFAREIYTNDKFKISEILLKSPN